MSNLPFVRRLRVRMYHFFYPQSAYQRLGLSRNEPPPRLSLSRVAMSIGAFFVLILVYYTVHRSLPPRHSIPFPMSESSTKVLSDTLADRVWRWEVASGRFPSTAVPLFDFKGHPPANPGVPAGVRSNRTHSLPAVGAPRVYLDAPHTPHARPYPTRPPPGAALDLDVIMDQCDFSDDRYVRDCLELLRTSLGLDPGVRRGDLSSFRALYYRDTSLTDAQRATLETRREAVIVPNMTHLINDDDHTFDDLARELTNRTQLSPYDPFYPPTWGTETSDATGLPVSPTYPPHPAHPTADPACPPSNPHVFHVFWAGPFTDKPYLMALSFLYTQRLQLHTSFSELDGICRPQLWIWINPGPASSIPDPSVIPKMRKQLESNPWSAPFLHDRFKDAIKFKLWNTTEQLDSIPEMVGWRHFGLFNSGGVKYGAPKAEVEAFTFTDGQNENPDDATDAPLDNKAALPAQPGATTSNKPKKKNDALFDRVGSKDASEYDRLSVVLSDMARFILTHRFGGIYLDADTILLQDWTPLFQTPQSFAYRWSRLHKYNTAVLKLPRGSAIGSYIFRTAIGNGGLDFHPMTVSKYVRDGNVGQLLLRLPDALFDSAWLNTEYYQRDRPPFPYFKRFEDFFDPPKDNSASPLALGFDGFFRGAFSYHFHNFWWIAFDKARNFPDLGDRFRSIVERGKAEAREKAAADPESALSGIHEDTDGVDKDTRDLPWSAVLKRTFEGYIRGERPNMYGEYIQWD